MNKLEVLADAIISRSGYLDPLSILYRQRNPGGLKPFSERHMSQSLNGYRTFKHHIDGYRALTYDLEEKCRGKSYSGLSVNSPLKELAYVFELKDGDIRNILKHIRKALEIDIITELTPIKFFLE